MNNLRLVEFAVALGQHRSFARAAESMGVTQPAFSRGIAALEKSLGVKLFDRSTRRVETTLLGQAFLERAEAVLEAARELTELTTINEQSLTGRLAIGSGPYPLECSVLPAAARLTALHPALQLQIREGPWRELPPLLFQGSIDLLVMEASIFDNDHRVQVEPLPQHPGCLVCRKGHPLLRLRQVTIDAAKPYPLVGIPLLHDVRPKAWRASSALLVDSRSGELMPRVATTSLHAMREIILHSDGLGFYPKSLAKKHGKDRGLRTLKTDFVMPSTNYAIVTLRKRTPSSAALAFMKALREVEQEQDDK